MISPGERFNTFGGHRLSKKADAQTFEIGKRYVISARKNAVYTFIHLVNRTVTNVPWVFWLQLIMTFIDLAIAVTGPFCKAIWEVNPGLLQVTKILEIIIRFVPLDSNKIVEIVIFVVYGLIDIGILVFTLIIINQVKQRKEVSKKVTVYFYLNSIFLPIFRCSMTCIFSEQLRAFFLHYTFGNFFLTLIALCFLLLHFMNISFFSFCMGTSPSPNLKNPLAIWCPDVMRVVSYDFFIVFNFTFLECTRTVSAKTYGIALSVYLVAFLIPFFIYQALVTYYISFFAYEFIFVITLATCVFECVIIIYSFVQFHVGTAVGIVFWLGLPMVINILSHGIIQAMVKGSLKKLNQCKPMTPIETENQPEITDDLITSYESLGIKNARQAVRIARIACIFSHPCFMDLSLVQFLIQNFQSALFELMHLSFLLPDQTLFVANLMDNFMDNNKPSLIQEAIMFQIVTSQSESSAELSPSLIREISYQNLQAMKCQQVLQKIWSSCYKGDITAMSRHAFTLEHIIDQLNKKWTYLALRYPFSTPILKEYIKFLKTTGCQHAHAEAICQANPKLEDTTVTIDTEINMNILKQAIEEATDRRPVITLTKMNLIFAIALIFVNLIMLSTVIGGYYLFNYVGKSVNLFQQFGICSDYLSQAPNNFYDIITVESVPMTSEEATKRDKLYSFTKKMIEAYNVILMQIPSGALRDQLKADHLSNFNFTMDNFSQTTKSNLINMLSQFLYYENSMSYIPTNDTLSDRIRGNIDSAADLSTKSILDVYDTNASLSKKLSLVSYIFYAVAWALELFVAIPFFVAIMNGLKEELKYLFSLYLTMARSTISKFIDGTANTRRTDHRSISVLLTSTVMGHTRSTTDLSQDDAGEEKILNVADTFKVLVNDSGDQSSVLPPKFTTKALLIFTSFTFMPLIIATANFLIMDFQVKELNRCMYTMQVISERTLKASLILYHLSQEKPDFEKVTTLIDQATKDHSTLLFSSKNDKISNKFYSSKVFQDAHFKTRCDDTSNNSCRSLSALFDDFITIASNKTSGKMSLMAGDSTRLREAYNNILFPMMDTLLTDSYQYSANKVTTSQNTLIIICVVCYILMFIIYFGFANPVRHELIAAVASVKLPLKFIDPIDLSDQAKLMQYLQGECDYGSSKFTDQQTGAPSGATFLNAMTVPFAVFESDLSLLFANNAFYSLLSTSREATVGLPLDEIFSRVLPFKENEDHPFNALLEAIQQLSRGVAAQNFCEIITAMEVRERSNTPVMIRLIGVCDEKKGAVHDEDKDFIEGKNIKATQYIVHITNLTKKKDLEEKLKHESDLTQKLLEYAVTKQVIRSLTQEDQMVAKVYEKKPLLAFNVRAASDDEGSDEILYGCQLFLRTFKDIVTSFSSISYLCNDAPTWYFIGGLGQNDNDVKIGEEELIQFALSILEVFGQSISNNAATLSAIIHFGDFGAIPLKMDFPRVELSGKDFLRVSNLSDKGFRGKLFLTEEALEEAKSVKGLVYHKNPEQICGENVYVVDKLNEMSMNLDEFTIK